MAALLSGVYELIKLRHECGAVPLFACAKQAFGFDGSARLPERREAGRTDAERRADEQLRLEREAAERRLLAVEEERRAAERAARDAERATEQYKREREDAERRVRAAEEERKATELRRRELALNTPAPALVSPPKSVADIASSWGLLGSWALDCTQSVSRQNAYLSYVRRGDGMVHNRDFGDSRDSNEILQAAISRDGFLELTGHFAGLSQTRRWVLIKKDGRIRAIANSNADGTDVSIRDGRFVANGNKSPWQTRCR